MHGEQGGKGSGEFHVGTVVRGGCVRVSGDPARVAVPGQPSVVSPASAGDKGGEPRIEMVRSGDVIQAIDILCGCGQHIRLHCHYTATV